MAAHAAAIYGEDNRTAVPQSGLYAELARSTAIAVLESNRVFNADGTVSLKTARLVQLCSDEKFYNEPLLSYSCTGFLVGPDLLATAGHCVYAINNPNNEIRDQNSFSCQAFNWLFDFKADEAGHLPVDNLPADRLYKCKRIVYATQQEHAPYLDYALIQLDRPVPGRTPFKLAATSPAVGAAVTTIGYPFGLAAKLTTEGRVTINNPAYETFVTNLDTFGGNSGSPVLNAAYEVTGILVRGEPGANTYTDEANQCERPNRCREDGTGCAKPDAQPFANVQGPGSHIQRITPIQNLIRDLF